MVFIIHDRTILCFIFINHHKLISKGTVQDKIFLSMGTTVRGYTKKGRMFLSFDTGLSEPIKCMQVIFSNKYCQN